jgi:uncharacterized membrane protein
LHRGYLEIGPDLIQFLPCPTFRRTWVVNSTDEDLEGLRQRVDAGPYEPIFAEVRGRLTVATEDRKAAGYEVEIELLGIERAFPGREGRECEQDLDFEFRASGHDPDWSLVLDGPRSMLRISGDRDTPLSPSIDAREEERILWIVPGTEVSPEWQIELVEDRCFDRSAPGLYSWRAEVRRPDRTLTGCAYRGTR